MIGRTRVTPAHFRISAGFVNLDLVKILQYSTQSHRMAGTGQHKSVVCTSFCQHIFNISETLVLLLP